MNLRKGRVGFSVGVDGIIDDANDRWWDSKWSFWKRLKGKYHSLSDTGKFWVCLIPGLGITALVVQLFAMWTSRNH